MRGEEAGIKEYNENGQQSPYYCPYCKDQSNLSLVQFDAKKMKVRIKEHT